jgi:hypothetical protein
MITNPLQLIKAKEYSSSELGIFQNFKYWTSNARHVRTTNNFLHHHALNYFSTLRPLFLHQLKSPDVLDYFSYVQIRDGLLNLMYFFYRWRKPLTGNTLLLIPSHFRKYVPEEWQNNVALYSLCPKESNEEAVRKSEKIYFIVSILDSRHFTTDYLLKKIQEIKKIYGHRWNEIQINLLSLGANIPTDISDFFDEKMKYQYEVYKTIINVLPGNVRHVTWGDLTNEGLEGSVFFDFNECDFYYSDSYVRYYLLSRGAVPFVSEEEKNDGLEINISLNHRFVISENHRGNDCRPGINLSIYKDIDRVFSHRLMRHEISRFNEEMIFRNGLKSCPRSFEDIVYEIVRDAQIH